MIKGIGIDLVELQRLKDKDERFIKRVLSNEEYVLYNGFTSDLRKLTFLGGRWAAKEALFKAFSIGEGNANFCDFVILNDDHGKPIVVSGPYDTKGLIIHLSISHTAHYATASVILEIN